MTRPLNDPQIPLDGITEEHKTAYAETEALFASTFGAHPLFTIKDASGNFLGPFGPLM